VDTTRCIKLLLCDGTLANPSNSSFWPNEQLDAIINLFKGFLNKEREFLLIKLQLCTVRVIHTLDFYSNQLLYFSIQIEYGKF
jgi:hypothetical protein